MLSRKRMNMKKIEQTVNRRNHLNQIAEKFLRNTIRYEHPEWIEEDGTCKKCDEYYESLLEIVEIK